MDARTHLALACVFPLLLLLGSAGELQLGHVILSNYFGDINVYKVPSLSLAVAFWLRHFCEKLLSAKSAASQASVLMSQ